MAKLTQKPNTYLKRDKYATRAETMERLLCLWQFSPQTEELPLRLAAGRISAGEVFSQNTLPVCRGAGADGVAVRCADFENGMPDFSKWQEGVDYTTADMGDDFDDAFDTVLRVEDFTFNPRGSITAINLSKPVKKGQLIKQQGDTLLKGELVMKKGDVITPFRLGILASAGIDEVTVIKRPRIAYMPTGSELIPAGQAPARGQNIESNSLMVEAFGSRWGAQAECLPIVADQKSQLEAALDNALQNADILLLNGGTSMGTEDYTSLLLQKRASHFQHGVRCIPGIPVAAAIVDGKPVVNLPGPPFAAFCALDWCAKALTYHWYGQPAPVRRKVTAALREAIQKPPSHEMYVRLEVQWSKERGYSARPISWDMRCTEAAERWNGLFIAPIGQSKWEAGSKIEAELLYTDC